MKEGHKLYAAAKGGKVRTVRGNSTCKAINVSCGAEWLNDGLIDWLADG